MAAQYSSEKTSCLKSGGDDTSSEENIASDAEGQALLSDTPSVNVEGGGGRHLAAREGGTSNFGTIMHIIKGNVGTGILAMPVAFSHAGILVGTVGLCILGIICVHCMHVLVSCAHYLCQKLHISHLDYAGVAEQSCKLAPLPFRKHSNKARNVINVFLHVTQFGFCCVYILFIAKNIKLVVQKCTGDNPDSAGYKKDYPMPILAYEALLLPLLIPFVFIKNMKHLAPFSAIANVASFIGLGIILYYILIHESIQPITRLPLFKSWAELPLYFGTAIYAFEGIGVVLPCENAMRDPRAFPSMFGVLNLGMTIVCALYITIGFYGYIEFGDDAQGSITLNLESWYGIVVQIIFSVCIFVSYGLQFYVPLHIIGPTMASSRLAQRVGPKLLDYVVRTLLVIVTFAVAAIVDEYLDLLIALIGSVASSALALIFPAFLDILTFWPMRHTKRFFWLSFCKDILIIILGLVGFVAGTVVAFQQLICKLSHSETYKC